MTPLKLDATATCTVSAQATEHTHKPNTQISVPFIRLTSYRNAHATEPTQNQNASMQTVTDPVNCKSPAGELQRLFVVTIISQRINTHLDTP
jgi:hypothetical protein